ncbi:DUF3307 domain-containing protein [Sphingobacterium hungaricum]|uniref:DUF3307 domain-containing protein n=1 Tax=Sphingobacterium hungaricum TaxID=2082723 RepID=A0A928YRE4_9SPHI|nr:DUF3307 domain-containing protein [Sphingobacterium hungaricum]MBE8714899.1 DUF3307 domain-containing protein [Sphingobacterium hungaricum]
MLIVFLKFIIAHVLGDFVFQPKKWVIERRNNMGYLFAHVLVHGILLCLFFYNDLATFWPTIVFVTVSHLAIDSLKIWWEKMWPYKPIQLFIADQILHIGVIVAAVCYLFPIPEPIFDVQISITFLLYSLAILLLVFVTPIFLKVFFTKWENENAFHNKRKDSLLDAGLIIGILERILILFFVQLGLYEGVGFLLAAKSIFRFGDLANAKDTKFTEYILIGTLLSFSIAIFVSYFLKIALEKFAY